jgi:hypothetical protein
VDRLADVALGEARSLGAKSRRLGEAQSDACNERGGSVLSDGRLTPAVDARAVATALAPLLSSVTAREPVAARPDAPEGGPRSTGAGRKAAVDRVPGDVRTLLLLVRCERLRGCSADARSTLKSSGDRHAGYSTDVRGVHDPRPGQPLARVR